MSAALHFSLSLFLSIALVPLSMRYAHTLGLIDEPDNNRKIHTRVIPRSGGIAIAIASLLPLLYFLKELSPILSLIIGSSVIVIFGFLDDRMNLDYKWKFLGQAIATAIFIYGMPELTNIPYIYSYYIPEFIIYSIVFLTVLGATNAVNLSDGLDGLAAGTVILSLCLIAFLAYQANNNIISITALGVAGALLGFLRYNTYPARVFMGDTGSQFIGFIAIGLAITTTQIPTSAVSPVLPLLILGLPIIDTLMVMAVRIYNGRSPFSPDRNHLHHQLMKLGLHHYEAVAVIYIFQILLILSAYALRYQSDLNLLSFFVAFALISLGLLYWGRREQWVFHPIASNDLQNDRRNRLLRKFGWYYNYSSWIIAATIGAIWISLSFSAENSGTDVTWLSSTLLVTAILIGWLQRPSLVQSARIIAYGSSALTLYLYLNSHPSTFAEISLNGAIAFIVLALAFAIRMTRREHFRLDNQDIIVLFVLIVMPLLPDTFFGNDNKNIDISGMIVRMAAMLYAIEFVIRKKNYSTVLLLAMSSVSLLTIIFV